MSTREGPAERNAGSRQRGLGLGAAIVVLTVAALLLRVPRLGNRPFHGDEAVHAFKFRDLWERGVYRYDPNEYHGPTLYYAALPAVALSGHRRFADTTEADYRMATVIAGAAMIPLLMLLFDALGRRATIGAALLTAISPAFVFYSRYYIQEVLLAAFTLAGIGLLWRFRRSGRSAWLLAAGACAGLMVATKETAVLSFVAAGVAWAVASRWMPRAQPPGSAGRADAAAPRTRAALYAAAVALAVAVAWLFLSGFFSNPRGPLGYVQTYTPWGKRAGGTALHAHPWYYYLQILLWWHAAPGPVWSEWVIVVLSLVGVGSAFVHRPGSGARNGDPATEVAPLRVTNSGPLDGSADCRSGAPGEDSRAATGSVGRESSPSSAATGGESDWRSRPPARARGPGGAEPGFVRFLAIYTLLLASIYSAIPYKTPWLMLSFLSGMILLAGYGAAALLEGTRRMLVKALAATLILAGCAQLGRLAYAASWNYERTAAGNPYVYAQPGPDVVNLGGMVDTLARTAPQRADTVVQVVATDDYYWPLPWYLRHMHNVGYWTRIPPELDAPILIISPAYDADEALTPKLPHHVNPGFYGLRPGVMFELWVRDDVWAPYVTERSKHRPKDAD